MCGQWVGVKLSSSLRPALYEAICPLLQPTEDLVVRLEAANTLKLDILFETVQQCANIYSRTSFNLMVISVG